MSSWVFVAMLAVIAILLGLLMSKTRKLYDQQVENTLLSTENQRLRLQVSTLQNNLEKIKAAQQEIQEIETKKKTKKKQEAPAAGDSDARLERLNS